MRALAALAATAALALSACGEKEETLEPLASTATVATTPQPRATTVQIEGAAAERAAAAAASAVLPKGFKVRPAEWTVSCARGADGVVTCRVRSGPCGGPVVIRPVKVPAGVPPEGHSPKPDASGVGCAAD